MTTSRQWLLHLPKPLNIKSYSKKTRQRNWRKQTKRLKKLRRKKKRPRKWKSKRRRPRLKHRKSKMKILLRKESRLPLLKETLYLHLKLPKRRLRRRKLLQLKLIANAKVHKEPNSNKRKLIRWSMKWRERLRWIPGFDININKRILF